MENSESSAAEEDILSQDEKNVRIFAKQMLQGRLFLGHFQEKRFVEPIRLYRDVVIVNESERDLIKDIEIVRKRLREHYQQIWIGITNPKSIGAPYGYSFWTESTNNTFGQYWYKIRSIKFRRNEVLLRLKTVRPMTEIKTELQSTKENRTFEALLENFKNTAKENFLWFFTDAFTLSNIKQTVTFLLVLIVTVITSSIYGIRYLMDYFLRLMRELSNFIEASTPVMLAVVNLFGKIVGGFYLLIAMMWRGKSQPLSSLQRPQLEYYQPRAIEPRYRPRHRGDIYG